MSVSFDKGKIILGSLSLLFILALLGIGYFYFANKNLQNKLNSELLLSELMLSEKLALQKKSVGYEEQLNDLKAKNTSLDKLLAQTNQQIQLRESELQRARLEKNNLKQLNKKLAELEQIKRELELQSNDMKELIQKMLSEKNSMNQMIASLQEENKQLAATNELLRLTTADHFMVESTKRKERLTVMAKRTRKMSFSFEVPDAIATTVTLKLIQPDGRVIEGEQNGIAHRVIENGKNYTASLDAGTAQMSKRIVMTYEPKEKPVAGIYRIELYNKGKYISNIGLKLR